MENILATYKVSRETEEVLKDFQNLVIEWNTRFNLISKASVEHIWKRHILDSIQLCEYIGNSDKVLYDLGSGAGFPGIVIAIVSKQLFPDLKIYLVESIGKKAKFLETAIKKYNLNAEVINDRIENIKNKKADIISSRALASLDKLIQYAHPLCTKKTRLLALKGQKWKEEVEIAAKEWLFKYSSQNSHTDDTGCILCLSDIRRK